MAKRTAQKAVLHRLVYEMRYAYGYTYLDRCGATINDILRTGEGWTQVDANPQAGVLRHEPTAAQLSFNSKKLSLQQEQSNTVPELMPVADFAELADSLTKLIAGRLDLSEFTRIGFRAWQLFETDSLHNARTLLRNSGLVDLGVLTGLDVGTIEEVKCTVLSELEDRHVRVAVTPVEQSIPVDPATLRRADEKTHRRPSGERRKALIEKAKATRRVHQFPQTAILVDVDAFIDDPPYPDDIAVADFATSSYDLSCRLAENLMMLPGRN